MISEIRKYIDDTIKSIDSKFEPHSEANTGDNIAALRYDKIYWVSFQDMPITRDSSFYLRTSNVTLDIASKGDRDPIKAHDDLWCFAQLLSDNLMFFRSFKELFQNVQVNSISPLPIGDNLNWTRLRISITIERSYNLQGEKI